MVNIFNLPDQLNSPLTRWCLFHTVTSQVSLIVIMFHKAEFAVNQLIHDKSLLRRNIISIYIFRSAIYNRWFLWIIPLVLISSNHNYHNNHCKCNEYEQDCNKTKKCIVNKVHIYICLFFFNLVYNFSCHYI